MARRRVPCCQPEAIEDPRPAKTSWYRQLAFLDQIFREVSNPGSTPLQAHNTTQDKLNSKRPSPFAMLCSATGRALASCVVVSLTYLIYASTLKPVRCSALSLSKQIRNCVHCASFVPLPLLYSQTYGAWRSVFQIYPGVSGAAQVKPICSHFSSHQYKPSVSGLKSPIHQYEHCLPSCI